MKIVFGIVAIYYIIAGLIFYHEIKHASQIDDNEEV